MDETNQNGIQVNQEDEINLVDICMILLRYKWIIVIVFLVCIALGGGASFLSQEKYNYSSTLEIGSMVRENGEKIEIALIEDPEKVKGKLEAGYIPLVQAQIFEGEKEEGHKPVNISVTVPKNSQIIVLKSNGTLTGRSLHEALHQKVVDYLLTDHQGIVSAPQKNYEILLDIENLKLEALEDPKVFAVRRLQLESKTQAAKMQLQSLKDQDRMVASRFTNLDKKRELLSRQVGEVTDGLNSASNSRSMAVNEVNGEAKAMTLLMMGNQVEQNRTRLAILQERLFIGLEEEREALESQKRESVRAQAQQKTRVDELESQLLKLLIDHERELEMQRQQIAKVKNKLDNLRPTRILGVAKKSLSPTGPRKSLFFALSGVLGLVGGIFAAFFVEFLIRVRRQQGAAG